MKLRAVRRRAIDELERAGVEAARTCVDWLIEDALGISLLEMLSDPDREISRSSEVKILDGVTRRVAGEPIQYIIGWTEFFGLRLAVTPSVLIPRPETESVVQAVLGVLDGDAVNRVLDVGAGSGCIALAIAATYLSSQVVACDVSDAALDVARKNAARLGIDVTFVKADVEVAESIAECGVEFDAVVSNPPYIPESEASGLPQEVIEHEPRMSLIAGDDALRFYRALFARARERLASGGWLVAELHSAYAGRVEALAVDGGFSNVDVRMDLAGLPRVLVAQWMRSESP